MKISGLTIIRNAINNGYPIAEVLDCLRVISDEIIVLDGYSTDGTYEYLCTQNDIKTYQDNWNINSKSGLEFARITNLGLQRCHGDYIFYLQADELLHHHDIEKIPSLINDNKSLSFNIFHIRYDFDYKLNGGYDKAIRIIKNDKSIYSHYDAYTFEGNIHPILQTDFIIYHVGYVFIKNILQKMINHYNLFYKDQKTYEHRKNIATKYLEILEKGDEIPSNIEISKILEPEYELIKHDTNIPTVLNRLIGHQQYTLP